MRRFGGRRWWGIAAVVVAGAATACSGSDDAPDVAEALDGADLTEATAALFGDEAAPPDDADLAERAALTADRIATSVEAFDDGEAAADRYEEAVGAGPADQMRRVGTVLGHTRAALAGADGDDAMAYALRLGWDLADRLADADDRLDWVLLNPDRLDATERDELTARLDDGDGDGDSRDSDGEAAELVRDIEGELAAADVIDSTLSEVSELVPADVEIDALSSLLTSYGAAAGPEES